MKTGTGQKKAYRGSISVATGEAFLSKYDQRNTQAVQLKTGVPHKVCKISGCYYTIQNNEILIL